MAVTLRFPLLSPPLLPSPPLSDQNPYPNHQPPLHKRPRHSCSRRDAIILTSLVLPAISLAPPWSAAATDLSEKANASSRKPFLDGIANTKSWSQYIGDGFSIRVPPQFDDIIEPEASDYNGGLTYYGDKAKPKPFAARFASPDRSEIVSVVIKPSNQLKITFLEASDITDLGSLKEAAKIFVPGGASLYSARAIKVKAEEKLKTYYFYEFGVDKQHVALVAAINSGKAYIAGATAPEMNWENDGVKLRSSAISLSVV
ncbi:hypothetical protein LUZ61_016746 [Rhynchospora tenuis]|uniref:PsbP C-terminal domain-containing protein n=1 Tax=Rhynchospora tenuis TaxID=198213 RepID=A0AAD5Z648_9POAL|nr:hypothetical protein LUZ61_016746 [Rhynchospora tenuis]